MSDATKDALDAALAAHIADVTEENALVTAYVIQAAYVTIGTEDRSDSRCTLSTCTSQAHSKTKKTSSGSRC